MKKTLLAVLAVSALPMGVLAQAPALTHVASVDVGSLAIAPHGVAIANDKVFTAGFSNAVAVQITDPLGTPAIASLGTLPTAFVASRGPQDIVVDGANVYIIADDGTTGRIYTIVNPGDATPTISGPVSAAPAHRFGSGVPFLGSLATGSGLTSPLRLVDPVTGVPGDSGVNGNVGTPPPGYGAPIRGVAAVGDTVYYVNTTSGQTRLASYTITTPGSFTAGTHVQAATTLASGAPANHVGATVWASDTTTYVVLPWNDTVGGRGIAFFDASDLSIAPVVITPAELVGESLAGIAVGEIAGTTVLAVASNTGGAVANEVHIFELPAAPVNSVSDWNMLH